MYSKIYIILHRIGQKLVAQAFDNANVMKGIRAKVQVKIKVLYNNTH